MAGLQAITLQQINQQISDYIGGPVARFEVSQTDKNHIKVYNIFKPYILKFYEKINKLDSEYIKEIMDMIYENSKFIAPAPVDQSMAANLRQQGATNLLQQSMQTEINLGRILVPNFIYKAFAFELIPIPQPDSVSSKEAFIGTWYNNLFNIEKNESLKDKRLSLVVQGGEAVNYYTNFKNENVPTHDLDTRILAGNYFNYGTQISAVPAGVKKIMHQYRFFVGFGLLCVIQKVWTSLRQHLSGRDEYRKLRAINFCRHFFDNNDDEIRAFFTTLPNVKLSNCRDINYLTDINNLSYRIAQDKYISDLMAIIIEVKVGAQVLPCGIIDLFSPRDYGGDHISPGHSKLIHSYFLSDQSKSIYSGYTKLEADFYSGDIKPQDLAVPNIEVNLDYGRGIPYIPELSVDAYTERGVTEYDYNIRIPVIGYLLWDTLRMLLVSDALRKMNNDNKFEKYKQKFNCLLTTLLMPVITREILHTTEKYKTSNKDKHQYLAGGRIPNTIQYNNLVNQIQVGPAYTKRVNGKAQMSRLRGYNTQKKLRENTSKVINTSTYVEPKMNSQFVKNAKEYSTQYYDMKTPIDLNSIQTKEEWAGYMDYLSITQPGWSDFRLPITPPGESWPMFTDKNTNLSESVSATKTGGKLYTQTKKNRKQNNKSRKNRK
jgi:hypothetical protein